MGNSENRIHWQPYLNRGLDGLARRVLDGLKRDGHQGLTLTLKVKYANFKSVTRSVTFPEPIEDMEMVLDCLKRLLANTDAGEQKVRLLGVTVSNFLGDREDGRRWVQLPLPRRSPPDCSSSIGVHPTFTVYSRLLSSEPVSPVLGFS